MESTEKLHAQIQGTMNDRDYDGSCTLCCLLFGKKIMLIAWFLRDFGRAKNPSRILVHRIYHRRDTAHLTRLCDEALDHKALIMAICHDYRLSLLFVPTSVGSRRDLTIEFILQQWKPVCLLLLYWEDAERCSRLLLCILDVKIWRLTFVFVTFSVHPRPIHATVLTGILSRFFPDRMTRKFAYLFIFTYMFDECFVNVVESFCLPNEESFNFFLTDVWYISFLFYLSLGYF